MNITEIIQVVVTTITSTGIIAAFFEFRNQRKLVVFSKLHEERATVIKEMYQKLVTLRDTMIDYTKRKIIHSSGGEDIDRQLQEIHDRAYNAIVESLKYFALNDLFLNNEIGKAIDGILKLYREAYYQYACNQSTKAAYNPKNLENFLDIRESEKTEFLQCVKENKQIAEKMKNDLPALIEELKCDFRTIIGIKKN
jgi:hypothetical protein